MGGWFHAAVKTVSRGNGRSATAAAAYRSAELIPDDRTGDTHDYTRRRGVQTKFILAPDDAPEWVQDRSRLWNAAEAAEKCGNARVARELELALPSSVSAAERETIARQVAAALVIRYGVAVDVVLHAPHAEGDQRNHHAHMLFTTREIDSNGFGKKTRELDDQRQGPVEIEHIRAYAAATINRSLERAGLAERVDHRSLEKQGIDRDAQQHQGPAATAKERRGEQSRIGDFNRQAAQRNRLRDEMNAKAQVIDLAIEREKRRVAAMEKHASQRQRWKDEQERSRQLAVYEAQYRADRADKERRGYERWGDQKRSDMAMVHRQRRADFEKFRVTEWRSMQARIEQATGEHRRTLDRQRQEIEQRQNAGLFGRAWQRLKGQSGRDRQALVEIQRATKALDEKAQKMEAWGNDRLDMRRRDLERSIREELARFERQYNSGYARKEAAGWILDRASRPRWKTTPQPRQTRQGQQATAYQLEPATTAQPVTPQRTAAEIQQAAILRRKQEAKRTQQAALRETRQALTENKGQLATEAINDSLRRTMNPAAGSPKQVAAPVADPHTAAIRAMYRAAKQQPPAVSQSADLAQPQTISKQPTRNQDVVRQATRPDTASSVSSTTTQQEARSMTWQDGVPPGDERINRDDARYRPGLAAEVRKAAESTEPAWRKAAREVGAKIAEPKPDLERGRDRSRTGPSRER